MDRPSSTALEALVRLMAVMSRVSSSAPHELGQQQLGILGRAVALLHDRARLQASR